MFQLLPEFRLREVAQRIEGCAPGPQTEQVFAVVVAVQQPYGLKVARRELDKNLVENGTRIEPFRTAVERVLPQPRYKTIIVGIEHGGVRL